MQTGDKHARQCISISMKSVLWYQLTVVPFTTTVLVETAIGDTETCTPFPTLVRAWQADDLGIGCAEGVAGSPCEKVEPP